MNRQHRASAGGDLMTALLEALEVGGIDIDLGRIEGYGGYYHPTERTVMLNPDATERERYGALLLALQALAPARPALRVIKGGQA